MFLRKIISIRNIGRFLNYNARGDLELQKFSLVNAENGRGKTTLCSILRSLTTNDPTIIQGRQTLGSDNPPAIEMLTDANTVRYSNGGWDSRQPDIAIFDSTFIAENVYSGDLIDIDQLRNLHKVIVGSGGVEIMNRIEALVRMIREKTSQIREQEHKIQVMVPEGIPLNTFVGYEKDDEIDAKILEAVQNLETVRQSAQILARPNFSRIDIPSIPISLETQLSLTIVDLAVEAEKLVLEQLKSHEMHAKGEAWLAEGLSYVSEDACPFCGQSIKENTLISAYQEYFSEAYDKLKTDLQSLYDNVSNSFSDRAIGDIEKVLQQNIALHEFWIRFCETTSPELVESATAGDVLRQVRDEILRLLEKKITSPVEEIKLDDAFTSANSELDTLTGHADNYNESILESNIMITSTKEAVGGIDVAGATQSLLSRRAQKRRHDEDAIEACDQLNRMREEKTTFDGEKDAAKVELDEYAVQIISRHEKRINDLLKDFGAGFQLSGSKQTYAGGVAGTKYQIMINETAVNLGNTNTPINVASFRNTLSSGDKSTL